jgi:hypothetical protein
MVEQSSAKSQRSREAIVIRLIPAGTRRNGSTHFPTPAPSSAPKGEEHDAAHSDSFGSHDLDDVNLSENARDEPDELSIDMELAVPTKAPLRPIMESFADLGDLNEEDMDELLALEEQQQVEDEQVHRS